MSLERLRLDNISKLYGAKHVLDDVTLSLSVGTRLALVGENGVGKTTLAHIITGEIPHDGGSVTMPDSTSLGYLPQDVSAQDDTSVQRYVEQATGDIATLREQMQQLEQRMTEPLSDDEMAQVLEDYGTLQAQYERRGGYDLPTRTEQIFAGLGISYIDQTRVINSLSGGERTRVALAALLLREPDVLLLDEPTNHLDFAGIEWLENYLVTYPHALLLITHDREFINRVANQIAELNPVSRNLTIYHGNYEDYLDQREQAYQARVAAYNAQQNDIKALQARIKQMHHSRKTTGAFSDDGDKFLRNFKKESGEDRVGRSIREAKHELTDLQGDKLSNPRHEWHIEFRFDPEQLSSSEPIVLEGLSKSFGDNCLFAGVDLRVKRGERVVLVAPNGTGKSTLLRILMGYMQPDSGTFALRGNIGYVDQNGETLEGSQTVYECLREVVRWEDKALQAHLHRAGLFSDEHLGAKKVRDLSVGQRRKLNIARMIASRANVLLLDEPTNHLDPVSIEALEDALLDFDGAILAVSHDRRFIDKVASRVWHIENDRIITQ